MRDTKTNAGGGGLFVVENSDKEWKVLRYLNWNERSKGAVIVKKVCGLLVILGRLYLIHTAA